MTKHLDTPHNPIQSLAAVIEARIGIDTGPHTHIDLRAIVARADIPQLTETLRHSPTRSAVWQQIIDQITVRETYFRRQPEQFARLRDDIMPTLANHRGKRLAIWSAGCATGEEAYSLGMVLRPRFASGPQLSITGTDLSTHMIEAAKRGVYRDWSLRDGDPAFTQAHFQQVENGYRLRDTYRQGIHFHQANLLETDAKKWADVVLCRHLLLYFTLEARNRAAHRLWEALRPGGWLLLGTTETLPDASLPWENHLVDGFMFYRKPGQRHHQIPPPAKTQHTLEPQQPEHYIAAVEAFQEKEYDIAERLLSTLTSQDNGHTDAHLLLAALDANQGRYEAAQARLASVLEREPLNADAHHLRGMVYLATERDQAEEALVAALYSEPGHPLAAYALGVLLWETSRRERALNLWQQAERAAATAPAGQPLRDYAPGTAEAFRVAVARRLSKTD